MGVRGAAQRLKSRQRVNKQSSACTRAEASPSFARLLGPDVYIEQREELVLVELWMHLLESVKQVLLLWPLAHAVLRRVNLSESAAGDAVACMACRAQVVADLLWAVEAAEAAPHDGVNAAAVAADAVVDVVVGLDVGGGIFHPARLAVGERVCKHGWHNVGGGSAVVRGGLVGLLQRHRSLLSQPRGRRFLCALPLQNGGEQMRGLRYAHKSCSARGARL
mmetsp:Transcript_41136/g.86111  ORF Transcript_41136/g.86111 Transcript_41136/m.86111 type:complete len:221 (+) Transcript_41136:413-1075(+)|eukprot:4761906-Pleurochrysis_carterae.AAC.6